MNQEERKGDKRVGGEALGEGSQGGVSRRRGGKGSSQGREMEISPKRRWGSRLNLRLGE